ncbi:MAG: S41 family peptidase [bacterium]
MNKNIKKSFISLLLTIVLMATMLIWANSSEKNIYATISENLTLLGNIYKEISTNYVEEIDSEDFLKAGINGMLNTLDPYTDYIEQDSRRQLNILTKGKYEGIGLLLNYRNNILTAAEPPFLGTPAARAGIREGDQIIKVDGKPTKELGFQESVRHILGPEGTSVTLIIKREGVDKLLEFTLVREKITVQDVRFSGMIENNIGYIQLTRFSQNSATEISQAIRELQNKNLDGLILDLRSNPGGVLQSAVNVSDIFLEKGETIVSIRGRTEQTKADFRSTRDPVYPQKPLIVLVNRISASASEIVAGAVQDHDRGILVGDTTYGKGLVQSVVPLSATTALKLTTAKYYTPSGRCIQRKNYSIWEDGDDNNKEFYTDNKRKVYGNGGIAPDIYVELPTAESYVIDLRRKSMFFNFAVHYANTTSIKDSSLTITDNLLKEFKNYLNDQSYNFENPFEKKLEELKELAEQEKYGEKFIDDINTLSRSFKQVNTELFNQARTNIKKVLKQEIASKHFGTQYAVQLGLKDDPVVQKALQLIKNKNEYKDLLKLN